MTQSGSRSGQRAEVAPPRDSASRTKRSGYVLLAVSGVVLATAFGGIAELSSPSIVAGGDLKAGNANSSSGPQLIPGNPVPGTLTVAGSAQPDPATSPTAVVTVGPDGKPVVTILPAPGSGANPVVLPPGTPIPPGTYIPPGTQIPPTNPITPTDPTSPPRDDTSTKPPTSGPSSSSPTSSSSSPTHSTTPSSSSSEPPASSSTSTTTSTPDSSSSSGGSETSGQG